MLKGLIVHYYEIVGSGRISKDETGMEYLEPDSTLALYFDLSQSPFVPPGTIFNSSRYGQNTFHI